MNPSERENKNRILFYLIEPEGCWEDNVYYYTCTTRIAESPDFENDWEWKGKLQEWLLKDEHFEFFHEVIQHSFNVLRTSVFIDSGGVRYFMGYYVKEILKYLATPEAQEKFGWEECCHTTKGFRMSCTDCNGTGKIKKKWLLALEEAPCPT